MSHEIETSGSGEAAAIFGHDRDAWHRLGTTVAGAFTAEEAMTIGHLGGWNVRTTPLQTLGQEVPGHFATVRDNPWDAKKIDVLGVVGSRYTPLQNEAHCEFLDALVDQSGATFDTAGSLRGGKEVFVSMKLPETMKVAGLDALDWNVVGLNSHDGSGAFKVLVTATRVVCANTQRAALRDHAASTSIRHTSGAGKAVQQAREALGMTFAYIEEFEAEAEKMLQAAMTDQTFGKILTGLFPAPVNAESDKVKAKHMEMKAELSDLWKNAPTMSDIRGTRWAGYQTITEYTDHYRPVRGGSQGKDVARAKGVFTSDVQRLKANAWDAFSVKARGSVKASV